MITPEPKPSRVPPAKANPVPVAETRAPIRMKCKYVRKAKPEARKGSRFGRVADCLVALAEALRDLK